ncbi:hypothetical protein [Spiroplasma endosymbiont of Nomada rufipes]|uniref:hypothetical protein n=1 Tax=Spiroplasma endosymbiont of Nomada rufipes TaxID=3077933 RepID=UPI00376ED8DB
MIRNRRKRKLGYQVHIECQGKKGPEYVLTEQEIKEADVVILATDVAIDLERLLVKKHILVVQNQ